MREANADTGRVQEVVLLAARHGVAEETIADGEVPDHPLEYARIRAQIEVQAITPGIAEVGKDPE